MVNRKTSAIIVLWFQFLSRNVKQKLNSRTNDLKIKNKDKTDDKKHRGRKNWCITKSSSSVELLGVHIDDKPNKLT